MKRKVMAMMALLFLLTACSKMDPDEMLSREPSEEETSQTGPVQGGEETEPPVEAPDVGGSGEANGTDGNEEIIDSIYIAINLLSSKNMPLTSESLEYRGTDMQYGAVLQNGNSFAVDYTFMLMVNGSIQPFILEGEDREVSSATYGMEAGEERIVHFRFKPVQVSSQKDSLLSLVGVIVKKEPATSIDNVYMNAATTGYNILLRAEKEEYAIGQAEDRNLMGEVIETAEDREEGLSCKALLSNKQESFKTISKVRNEEISIDKAALYVANRGQPDIRLFLLNEGELLEGFDGKLYADVQNTESCLYKIEFNKEGFHREKLNKCCFVIVDMEKVQAILSGESDSWASIVYISQMFRLS